MPKKYFIASDFHLEFRQGQENKFWSTLPSHTISSPTTAIVAGDFTTFGLPERIYYKHFTRLINRFDKVIYVPGNHEYYGSSPQEVQGRLALLEKYLEPNLKILRAGEPYVFDGQRFIGDTMWFPDRPEVHIYRRTISDSYQIKGLFPWCFTQSGLFLQMLDSVRRDDIVVSHHVPTDIDTRPQWKLSPTQSYFVNRDCDLWWQSAKPVRPKAWIYGHTHDKHNYVLDGCQFICNPVGYPGENDYLPEAAEPCIYEL